MNDIVKISKTLSYWLRHRPDAAGLSLDEQGWSAVEPLLTALGKEHPGADWDKLIEVVDTNDKQRFELCLDTDRIRARQGHSIAVTGDWPITPPPEFLFHGTVDRFVDLIVKEGLKPMRRHHVHLSPDIETARKVGARRGKPVILKVAAGRLANSGCDFRLTGNGVWLVDAVPPEFIAVEKEASA